ncbi:MAG: DUF288 domain-containing protein [Phycisphaera sp. RhM]|nr:DUF288 domain-containing protein [Phycisphaera sp. RhM]
MLHVVITTIQRPTASVFRLAECLSEGKARFIIAGDTKGPDEFDLSSVDGFEADQLQFLDINSQLDTGFELAALLPTKHYCRKNVGYLLAMQQGASCIYETDDDNAPLENWTIRQPWVSDVRFADRPESDRPNWYNVYKYFSDKLIWPRGLPLTEIHEPSDIVADRPEGLMPAVNDAGAYWAPIQQGLADGAPDVDAIWRLALDEEFTFNRDRSVMLAAGQWCPFNTQTTWWWPAVYALMYVPSYCSFRMCDIWKSFVAQRCLWELGTGIVFHAPEVVQERNPHNLMRDFDDEIPGYQQNNRLAEVLESLQLQSGVDHVADNLLTCYQQLVEKGFFPEKELPLVKAWIRDVGAQHVH